MRIGEIECLEADFKVVQHGSFKGNLAFDLWATEGAAAEPADITHEIMIWLSREGFQSGGSRQETLSLDGREVGLWKMETHNPSEAYEWTYLAFVHQSDLTEGPVDLNAFLRHLVENGHLSPDAYLSGIQLGNEIVSGHGATLIRDFQIRLCGR